MKYIKRITNGVLDWVRAVPDNSVFSDSRIIEITVEEYTVLSQDDDMDSPPINLNG